MNLADDDSLPYVKDTGWCPTCRANTGFRTVFGGRQVIWPSYSAIDISSSYSGRPVQAEDERTIRVLECQICNETVTVLEARRPHETYITGVITDVRIIHPLPEPEGLDDSIPTDIADLFREGSLCETVGAYRAAAGVYRACVEMVCKDQGFTSGKLYDKIEALKASLGADSYIADDMHEARSLGNDGLHDGLAYSHAEVQDVAGLIREALLVLYVQPAEKKRFKELRQANRAAFRAQGRGNNSATAAPPAPQS